MIDLITAQTFERFCDRSLPKSDWTHEAHLRVCWAALAARDHTETIDFLRDAISSYNEATGVANTPTGGYHETLTRYFVGAVARLDAEQISTVLDAPRCRTTAPLAHWSSDLLFGHDARARWMPPDLAPLGWPTLDRSDDERLPRLAGDS